MLHVLVPNLRAAEACLRSPLIALVDLESSCPDDGQNCRWSRRHTRWWDPATRGEGVTNVLGEWVVQRGEA
jgi:hypothetical protein